jgi:hypothetical protein
MASTDGSKKSGGDTTPPAKPSVTVTDGDQNGRPEASGTTEPGANITVTWPDHSISTTTAHSDGNWKVESPARQPDGQVSVVVTDNAGNASEPGTAIYYGTPPATPDAPTSYNDDAGAVQDAHSAAAVTDDARPGINIGAGLTDTPRLYVNGQEAPATYDPKAGTLTPDTALDDGHYQFTYTLTDAAGNESVPSDALDITIDTQAPATPGTPADYLDDVGAVQNTHSAAAVTDDARPGINIGAGLTDTPRLYVNGQEAPATYDPKAGTLTPDAALDDGHYQFTYTLTDAAGNESVPSDALDITIDTQAPTPVIALNPIAGDNTVNAAEATASVTITGNLDGVAAGDQAVVIVTINDIGYPATVNDEGTYFFVDVPGSELALATGDGAVTASVTVTDSAGNRGSADTSQSYVVDYKLPAVDLHSITDDGMINAEEAAGTITIDGTLLDVDLTVPGTTVTVIVTIDGVDHPAAISPDGKSFSVDVQGSELVAGDGKVTATVTVDIAGGGSISHQDSQTYEVHTDVPQPRIMLDPVNGNNVIHAAPLSTPIRFTGALDGVDVETGETATVVVTINDRKYTATVSEDGKGFSVEVPYSSLLMRSLTNGTITAHVSVTDKAGNHGSADTDGAFVLKMRPDTPTLTVVDSDGDDKPTAEGTAAPGAKVTVTWPDGSTSTTQAGEDGKWTVEADTPQTSGEVTAKATDEVGNDSNPATCDHKDVTAPEAPMFTVNDSNNDGKPTAEGQAEPGAIVTVIWPDGSTSTAQVGSDGKWSVESETPQGSGEVTAKATDQAGNDSADATVPYIDAQAPKTPTLTVVDSDGDDKPTASGTAEPGAQVTVTWPDGSTSTTQAGEDGKWTVESDTPQGSGEVTAKASDQDGNQSGEATCDYIDETAPEAPMFTVNDDDNDGKLTAEGQAEPGTTVTVTWPDGSTSTAQVDSDGKWSVEAETPQGSGEVTAKTTDQAGNDSADATVPYADAQAPKTPTLKVSDDDADNQPTASGTAEPGSTVTVTWPDGSTSTTQAGSDGKWSVEPKNGSWMRPSVP